MTVFLRIWGNNGVVVSKKEEVQTKSECEAMPRCDDEGESIGVFLVWMFLYWIFTCVFAISLSMTV